MEKPFINHIVIDLRGRDFKGPNCWFVSPRGASRDAGTDVIYLSLFLGCLSNLLCLLNGVVGGPG